MKINHNASLTVPSKKDSTRPESPRLFMTEKDHTHGYTVNT